MARIVLIIFVLSMAATLPRVAAAETIDSIVATVNDEIITSHDVSQESERLVHEAERKGPLPLADKVEIGTLALNRLIDKLLIAGKIRELDIRITDEEVRLAIEDVKKQNNLSQDALVAALRTQGLTYDQYKAQIREQLERLRLMSQEVRAKVQVGEKEMEAYYDANRARFGEEEMFRARQIFFRVDRNATPQEKQKITATAESVLKEAREGKDFVALAKKYSEDPNAAKDGGDLGAFRKGEMLPESASVIDKMKPGEVSGLITTAAGIHIIKLEERFLAKPKPFADVKGEIENILYQKKSEDRFNQWLADLRKEAAIEIRK